MPSIVDPDSTTITVATSEKLKTTLPVFATFSGSTYSFNPVLATPLGTYNLDITLGDGLNSLNYTLAVTVVVNQPPIFNAPLLNQNAVVGFPTITYTLPSTSDPENVGVTIFSAV